MLGTANFSSFTSAAGLVVTAFLLYQATKVIYRLYFHPLRNFPGPKLAAATFWYETYFDVFVPPSGQFIYELDRLHAIYGPVIRCNPEEIHVKDSEWFDTLYAGPGHAREKWERANRANGSPLSVASTIPHDLHSMRRRALNPFFSKKAVNDLEASTRQKIDALCARLREFANAGRVVDLGRAATAVTMDVITEYCFDDCYDCTEDPELAPQWKALMTNLFDGVPIAKHFPGMFNAMQSLPRSVMLKINPTFRPFFECKDTIEAQAREIWKAEQSASKENKEDDGVRPKTVFHGILHSSLPPEEKSMQRLAEEAFVLIVAGGETTARTITTLFSRLLENPAVFKGLRDELDKVVNPDLPPSSELENIPLMRAVVREGMRVSAPVTNRQILIAPNEDLKCHDFVIPRGTPTSMTFQDVLFDPLIFPDPQAFNPDRWLEAEAQGKRLDRYLVTFAKGNRSCLGINIAYSEMYLITAALVTRFDMRLFDFDAKRDLDTVRDAFIGLPGKGSKGVRVEITARGK